MSTNINIELKEACLRMPIVLDNVNTLIEAGANPAEKVLIDGCDYTIIEWLIDEYQETEEHLDIPLHDNYELLQMFAKKGININTEFHDNYGFDGYPLWNLQYARYPDEGITTAKLLLEYGADPNFTVEGETLYEYVLWKLVATEEDCYDFQRQFVQLLLAYGGKAPSYGYKWKFDESVDDVRILKDLAAYQTYFRDNEYPYSRDGYIIEVDTGKEIAWL